MRALLMLFLLLLGCGQHQSQTFVPMPAPKQYVLTKVGGDNQTGVALYSPLPGCAPLDPLVVEVRDEKGKLANGVLVRFEGFTDSTGFFVGPLYLGDDLSGTSVISLPPAFPLPYDGLAKAVAEAYRVGYQPVTAFVDESNGISNVVTFSIWGK